MNFFLLKSVLSGKWRTITELNIFFFFFFAVLKLLYLNVITRMEGACYNLEMVVLEMQRSLCARLVAGRGKNL